MKNFLAIGDITIDDFIELKSVEIEGDRMCMSWRDKIPFLNSVKTAGVGNAPNASVAASRIGLASGIITHVGDDSDGKACIKTIQDSGVSIEFIKTHPSKTTNFHYVLTYESDRTILVRHEDFDYADIDIPKSVDMIYLTSVGKSAEGIHAYIAEHVKKTPDLMLAFQPGTFQLELGVEKLLLLYKECDLFFCNIEESQRILKSDTTNVKELLNGINKLGPKIVLITDGPSGAYMYSDGVYWFMPTYPDPSPPKERTGAGDAFSSTFASFIAKGKSPVDALTIAPINSMSVVQHIGAQKGLLTEKEIEDYLAKAPADYKPRQLG